MIWFSLFCALLAVGLALVALRRFPRNANADAVAVSATAFGDTEVQLALSGDRIGFVKRVRDAHGLTLRQAAMAYDVLRARG